MCHSSAETFLISPFNIDRKSGWHNSRRLYSVAIQALYLRPLIASGVAGWQFVCCWGIKTSNYDFRRWFWWVDLHLPTEQSLLRLQLWNGIDLTTWAAARPVPLWKSHFQFVVVVVVVGNNKGNSPQYNGLEFFEKVSHGWVAGGTPTTKVSFTFCE